MESSEAKSSAPLFVNIVKVFSAKIIAILGAVVLSIVLARFLGAEKRGFYASLMAVVTLVVSLGRLGISQSIAYFTGKRQYNAAEIFTSVVWIWCFSAIISALIVLLIMFFQGMLNLSWKASFLAVAIVPFSLLLNYFKGIILGKNRIGKFSKLILLEPAVSLVLVVIFLIALKGGVVGAITAILVANIVLGTICLFFSRDHIGWLNKFDLNIIKKILSFGVVYGAALFFMQLNYRVDILILKHFVDLKDIGQYAVAVSLVELIWLLPQAISVVIFAKHATTSSKPKEVQGANGTLRIFRLSIFFICICSVILFFSAKTIIPFVCGREYVLSGQVARILLPGVIGVAAYKILYAEMAGKGDILRFLPVFLFGAILNIVLNVVLIPVMGINGAALSSTISYLFVGGSVIFIYTTRNKISVKELVAFKKDDFNMRFV